MEDVDALTWPQIKELMVQIKKFPPHDFVVGSQMQAMEAQATQESKELPVKKGKVKRRPNDRTDR